MIVRVFQEDLEQLVQILKNQPEMGLFILYLFAHVHPEKGTLVLNARDVASKLDFPVSSVEEWIQNLKRDQILIPGKRIEDKYVYQVTPSLVRIGRGYNGSSHPSSKNFWDQIDMSEIAVEQSKDKKKTSQKS